MGRDRAVESMRPLSAVDAPQALGVTHWFDSGTDGEPYSATVRFTGRRAGLRGKPTSPDTFVREETIDGVVPGSGPVSITAWVYGVQPGEWIVTAELIPRGRQITGLRPRDRRGHSASRPLPRADWSWRRWALGSAAFTPLRTRWSPAVRLTVLPAVIPGSWSVMVGLGVLVGVAVQAALLARGEFSIGSALMVDALALLSGLGAAKLLYLALSRRPQGQSIAEGWSVDGFLVATPLVAVSALFALGMPIGAFLDASAPGLFLGVAIGRLGCFFTGCCAGRCTRSRWGIWSSDRRVGARRIPTQLLESASGLLIGVVALALLLARLPGAQGLVFLAGAGAYVLIRQLLLRLRAEPHHPTRVRVTAAGAGMLLLVGSAAIFLS